MIFFYIILFVIVLCGLRYKANNQEYISVQQTNAIKGIFIWLVFMGHIMPYITKVVPFELFVDKSSAGIVNILKQLVVVPFLFYSGYGVMNSIKNKGMGYVDTIPQKRLLNTMLNFGIAVLFFVALNLILNISMDLKQILLSLVCWESVANSNWYIFTICFCYLTSYVCYKLFGYSKKALIANFVILSAFAVGISRFKDSWWYDTSLAYSAGSLYCYYKDNLEKRINRNYLMIVTIGGGIAVASYILMLKAPIAKSLIFMNICSICFCFFMVILTMRLQLKSKALEWSGKNLFPLYIYQRIPMILLSMIGGGFLVSDFKYLYVIICAIVSIIIVYLYKYVAIKL